MEPRNKQALIWIIAFFLILNVGLGLFALMGLPKGSRVGTSDHPFAVLGGIQIGVFLMRLSPRAEMFCASLFSSG